MSNTLSKEVTRRFFKDENGYSELKKLWRNKENPTMEDHLIYAVLRGKDWRKGFTEISNPVKLKNGQTANQSIITSLYNINQNYSYYLSDYNGILSEEAVILVAGLLIERKLSGMKYDCLNKELYFFTQGAYNNG